jgi:hypothetical protein
MGTRKEDQITDKQKHDIMLMVKEGFFHKEIAAQFGISAARVSNIATENGHWRYHTKRRWREANPIVRKDITHGNITT